MMDQLAKDARKARKAGLSYGQWKAMQEPVKIVPKVVIPKGWKACAGCGKAFKPIDNKQRYCELYCRNTHYYSKNRDKFREKSKMYRERHNEKKQERNNKKQ